MSARLAKGASAKRNPSPQRKLIREVVLTFAKAHLGLVTPGKPIRVPLDNFPPLPPDQLFALTIEPEGGSPTNLPTGPIHFIGRAVRVAA